ncbi:MAG: dCTP deaminase [Candidatus Altiarchaeota archaeon]|nr:dCTP deaminase [Candidatus Altiarchaeota archaeon]
MIITGNGLKNAMESRIKIEPFRRDQLSSETYDITLGTEFLRLKSEETPILDPKKIDVVGERMFSRDFILQPNRFVLARSEEWLELPADVMCMVSGKSSLARLGLQVHAAAVLHSGHRGYVVLEISNLNSVPFKLISGLLIAQLLFFNVEPSEEYYKLDIATFKTQKKIELPERLKF